MKTAVLISGDARTFSECYPSLETCILSKNNCDLFIHVYEDEKTSEVIETLSPKKVLVEKKNEVSFLVPPICETNKPPEVNAFGVMCQWRNIQKAFDLIDGDYDCVFKTRYDLKYTNPLVFSNYNCGVLNVPLGGDWRGGLFDMIGFGSYQIMSNYCSLFERISDFCQAGIPCHSETLNRFNNKDVVVNRFEYTVLLRKQFDRGYIEDRVFTLR